MAEKKSIIGDFGLSVLKDQKLFNDLLEQLEKDIQLSGLDTDGLVCDTPEDYLKSLILFLEDKLRTDPEKLRALFYRIDMNEPDIVSLLYVSDSNDKLLESLSKALIIRELQKIYNRKKYG